MILISAIVLLLIVLTRPSQIYSSSRVPSSTTRLGGMSK